MRSSLPLRGYSSGSGIIPLQQHDQSIVDVEFGKAKDATSSTFFLCPYFRLWATPSSMRLACGRPLSRSRKFILVPGQLPSPKQAPVYPRAGLCRGREVCLVQEMVSIYPVPGQTSPAAAAAPKQAPVYHRAGLCRGREVCLVQEMTGICPVPGQTSPAAAAAPGRNPFFAPPERVSTRLQPDYP